MMKGTVVRICAWFTLIIFGLMSLVGLIMLFTEPFSLATILAFLMCLVTSLTGWHARKYGLPEFRPYAFSGPIAAVSMILGIVLITLVPILFASSFGFSDSWFAIRNLLLLFFPVVISAMAILTSKGATSTDLTDNLTRTEKRG
jgi:hypothetical protein